MSSQNNVPPVAPRRAELPPDNSMMGSNSTSSDADGMRADNLEREDRLTTFCRRIATEMMLDIYLNPKPTKFENNNIPGRSTYISQAIEDLKSKFRRLIFGRFQRIERAFGPSASSHENTRQIVKEFEDKRRSIEEAGSSIGGTSEVITFGHLEKVYNNFLTWLDTFYDGLLNIEFQSRFELALKKLRAPIPAKVPYYFLRAEFHTYTVTPGVPVKHESLAILPVSESMLRTRVLDGAFQIRSNHTDKFYVFRLMAKEVKNKSKRNTNQMERMITALKNKYSPGFFEELCKSIDRQAKIIIRRFGVDYFFSEDLEFRQFLQDWARRYCAVADHAWEKSMGQETWAREVAKVLYAMLEFLKVSHDALLEREVDIRLQNTISFLAIQGMTVTPAVDKFTIRRAKIVMVNQNDQNSREKIQILLNDNQIAAVVGEVEEPLIISQADLKLPFDTELFKTKIEDEHACDDMFPNFRDDDDCDPIWHTKPEMGNVEKCVVPKPTDSPLFGSMVSSRAFPSQSASQQRNKIADPKRQREIDRSAAPNSAPSKPARTNIMRGSSPARPSTPTSNPRLQAANRSIQDNDSSKNDPISCTRTPTVDQHPRRPSELPNEGREKITVIITNQTKRLDLRNDRTGPAIHPQVKSMKGAHHAAVPRSASGEFVLSNPPRGNNSRDINDDISGPHHRLSKWLNNTRITGVSTLPTRPRPGEPFFGPSLDVAAHFQSMAPDKNRQPASAQPKYRTQEEAYQASTDGKLARQLVGEALGTDLNIHPKWPASVLGVGQPFQEDWASKPIPQSEGLNARNQWSMEWSEQRAGGHRLADREFIDEINRIYD